MTAAAKVTDLVKSFGHVRALDGLDLEVRTGEVHGFLGPNGAGKTTTIRVLLGLLRPTSGRAEVLGGDPWADAAELHRRLAYVPGDVTLWPTLTGGEVIDLLARLRGTQNRTRRDELVERFELDPRKRCRTYSKGNRQKVALIAALASEAELLILDEPTSGLDPLMESIFATLVVEEKSRGRTVLLSSHILSEAEALCDRVSIIRAGRIVESAPLAELRGARQTLITAELSGSAAGLDAIPGLHDLTVRGATISCRVDAEHLNDALYRLTTVGVRSITSGPPSLEELFLQHYQTGQAAGTVGAGR